jgi:hypothetical protein
MKGLSAVVRNGNYGPLKRFLAFGHIVNELEPKVLARENDSRLNWRADGSVEFVMGQLGQKSKRADFQRPPAEITSALREPIAAA